MTPINNEENWCGYEAESDLYFPLQMHSNKVSEKPQADSYFFHQSNMLAKD